MGPFNNSRSVACPAEAESFFEDPEPLNPEPPESQRTQAQRPSGLVSKIRQLTFRRLGPGLQSFILNHEKWQAQCAPNTWGFFYCPHLGGCV